MKSTFYNEEQSVKSAPKKLTDMLSFNSCDLLTLRGIILCKIKNALQLCLRIPPHVRWPFASFVWIFYIIDAFLRRQNSMVHNFRKNTEQFLP